MFEPESVLENVMQKILWHFDIQTNPLFPARKPDREVIEKNKRVRKRICYFMDSTVSVDHKVKIKESDKIETITRI